MYKVITMTDKIENHESSADIPGELIANIKTLFDTDSTIPGAIDDAIIAEADRYLVRRRRFRALKWMVPVAAAASLTVVLLSLFSEKDTAIRGDAISLALTTEDITILDAFRVARIIRTGERGKEEWDVNHDGTVDQADVNELIAAAVRL
jgi:hypothetical protein